MIDWDKYEHMKPLDDDAYLAEARFSEPGNNTVGHVRVHQPVASLMGDLLAASITVNISRYTPENAAAVALALTEAVEIARVANEVYQSPVRVPAPVYDALIAAQQSAECDMKDPLTVVRWLHRQSERQFGQGGGAAYDATALWLGEQAKPGGDDLYRKGLMFGFEPEAGE